MSMDQIETTAVSLASGQGLTPAAQKELSHAMARLKAGGSVVVRLADLAGGVLGRTMSLGTRALGMVPGAHSTAQGVVEAALRQAFNVAVLRLGGDGQAEQSRKLARPLVVMSGVVGGFLGLGGFVPDAAVTTLAIMREIARIAQEEGESLDDPDTREACLQVFAFAPAGRGDLGEEGRREPETSYFTARLMLTGRPLTILLADVAARFGVTLSQKFALQAIPLVGAVSGATLNNAFLSHYRGLARAHFTVRRLERMFGEEAVRLAAADATR